MQRNTRRRDDVLRDQVNGITFGSLQLHCSSSRLCQTILLLLAILIGELVELANAAEGNLPSGMEPYTEVLRGSDVTFDMVPIPRGEFVMGSPESENKRAADEGPQHVVKMEPFWMGKHEVRWDEYDIWSYGLDIQKRRVRKEEVNELDAKADAVTKPTKPYTDMTFGMGRQGFPAICMTQHAAKKFCDWLSAKTGHYYRLPTEAEWEYACRAGTTTPYSFGNSLEDLDQYAWHHGNSGDKYHQVGQLKPNPWGLHDMHGNVAEWCLDKYEENFYSQFADTAADNPICIPSKQYPRVARGGSWDDESHKLRSAARTFSTSDWQQQDTMLPRSAWYLTDALGVGFRVVRPYRIPSAEEIEQKKLNGVLPVDVKESRVFR